MTTPNPLAPITRAELHDLWQRQDQRIDRLLAAQEKTTQAIAQMREANAERDARRDKEMGAINAAIAKMSAAIDKLTEAQERNNQDIGNLKGWGLEIYCARNPEIFGDALGLDEEERIPRREIQQIAGAAMRAGIIARDQCRNLVRADIFIYAREVSENQPFCLVVETSYQVQYDDVDRAADRAAILNTVIQQYRPRLLNGQAVPVVAGTKILKHIREYAEKQGVTYVKVPNGQKLTNPPE